MRLKGCAVKWNWRMNAVSIVFGLEEDRIVNEAHSFDLPLEVRQ